MTTTTAVTIPWPEHITVGYTSDYFKPEEDVISKWRGIMNKASLLNLLDYPLNEIEKRVNELYSFVHTYEDIFIVERRPVSDNMLKDHFEKHYDHLNKLVSDKILLPRDAVKIGRYIYLYDCVYPHLSEDIIKPRKNPEESMRILVIPSKLYNWMVRLDYLWFKLLIKKKLDRDILGYLDENYERFMKDAIKLKIFLPIPPKKLHGRRFDLEEMFWRTWFRKVEVNWEYIVENFYREIVSFLLTYE